MTKPHFIDFHLHSDLKTFMSANTEGKRISCWRKFNVPLLLKLMDSVKMGGILSSQSTLRQLNRRRGTIALAGLMAYEKTMITTPLFQRRGVSVNLIKIARILKMIYWHKCLDPELLKRISSPATSYFDVFNESRSHLIDSENRRCGYKLLKSKNDYDPRKLNIILTIEGGHNLFGTTSGLNAGSNVLTNLDAMKFGNSRYLFMNLAHLEQNPLCTHAYNMKIFDDRKLKPSGHGITPLGRDVIRKALIQPGRILIDVKHMSLRARKDYYQILQDNYRSENIPIIVSHGGVTGISYQNINIAGCWPDANNNLIKVQYIRPAGHIAGTRFNPCSINLYDEEIGIIIRSKGIIGLNFDERLLGIKKRGDPEPSEYFSMDEFDCTDFIQSAGASGVQDTLSALEQEIARHEAELESALESYICDLAQDPVNYRNYSGQFRRIRSSFRELQGLRAQEESPLLKFERSIKYLCNNILHIVRIGGAEAWEHICIGSDFDGLIKPIEACKKASKYKSLSQALRIWLPMASASIGSNFYITNIDKQVDDIMFGNAYKFLCANFN